MNSSIMWFWLARTCSPRRRWSAIQKPTAQPFLVFERKGPLAAEDRVQGSAGWSFDLGECSLDHVAACTAGKVD